MSLVHYTVDRTNSARHTSWRQLLATAPKAELEQSLLRLAIPAIAAVVLLALWAWNGSLDDGQVRGLAIAIAFLLYAGTLTLHIVLRGEDTNVRVRRILGIISDNAVNTYFMFVMDEGGAIVFGVYLFVTFGNGFRFGRLYLHLSQLFSILGFCTVLAFSPFWSQHLFIGAGILIALLVLPFYVGVLAQRITEAKQRADEANRAKDRFLANVSHEMRTPLNGVIAMADLLRVSDLDERQADMVDTLVTSAQLALKQVDDVLNAAKIEAGRVTALRKPFDLAKLIQDTVRVVQPQASLKNLEVSTEQSAETPRWFIGDPHLIQQILLNLVSNAVKFTEKGSVIVRTKQSVAEGGTNNPRSVRIEVQDTGIGIAEEKLATIFEAFAQADDSITRVYGGTGLGTTIARQLTKLMGGAIGVESTPGVGSLFWIELPLAPCAPSDTEEARSSAPTSTRDYNLVAVARRGARVLVAEDNPTNQRVTKLILESRGHLATIVSNGEDALDALETDEFDIALVDLSMPKLSGLDVIRAYRFIAPNPIPVLILSANVTTELIDASLAAGAAEFVSKPVRASTLLDAIDRQVATFNAGNGKLFGAAEVQSNGSHRLKVVSPSILDDSVLEEISRMTTDPTFLGRLLRGFRDDCERLVPQLANDLETGRIESARDVAHALKGGAGGVGAFALMHAAAKLEKLSNVECVEQAAALWAELDDCARKTIAAISRKVGDESLHPAAPTSKRSISTSAAITATTASTAQHH